MFRLYEHSPLRAILLSRTVHPVQLQNLKHHFAFQRPTVCCTLVLQRHNLSVLKDNSISKEELQHQVAALTSQLEAKEQQLQEKKLRLADLQAELSRAQQQRKIAMEGQFLVMASCLSAFLFFVGGGGGGGGACVCACTHAETKLLHWQKPYLHWYTLISLQIYLKRNRHTTLLYIAYAGPPKKQQKTNNWKEIGYKIKTMQSAQE